MNHQVSDAATGWSFTYLTDHTGVKPDSGLVLSEIQHDGHNFAKDIRTIGVRLIVAEVQPPDTVVKLVSHFLHLGTPAFDAGDVKILTPAALKGRPGGVGQAFKYLKEADEALYLKTYFSDGTNYVAYGLRADFTMRPAFAAAEWPNAAFAGLTISQLFLFSRYASSPPHEPGGSLNAARCHPMINFAIVPNAQVDKTKKFFRIERIRFDYRLHLFVDRHHDVKTNATLAQIGNNAGVFRDAESVGGPVNLVGSLVASGVRRTTAPSVTGLAFEAVEKPLPLEIATTGLVEGLSVFRDTSRTRICWDNVHWWGSRGAGQPLISAPGAFHAVHVHWRWGGGGLNVRGRIPEIDTTGVPVQASNTPAAGGIRGALVDPHIWMQTIRVAVTKNEPTLDPNDRAYVLQDLSKLDWATLFTARRSAPADIEAGADIVLWYSVEAHSRVVLAQPIRTPNAAPTLLPSKPVGVTQLVFDWSGHGTVFLHGMFFAHEAERSKFFKVGTTSAEHSPNSVAAIRKAAQWFRTAE